jgi:hypothetical protein
MEGFVMANVILGHGVRMFWHQLGTISSTRIAAVVYCSVWFGHAPPYTWLGEAQQNPVYAPFLIFRIRIHP